MRHNLVCDNGCPASMIYIYCCESMILEVYLLQVQARAYEQVILLTLHKSCLIEPRSYASTTTSRSDMR